MHSFTECQRGYCRKRSKPFPAQVWLAVGQWNSNKILFKELATPNGQELAVPFSFGQPRSLALGSFEGRSFVFVGTSDGAVVYFELNVNANTDKIPEQITSPINRV